MKIDRSYNMNKFADESMRFACMYTEPSPTPTRVAFTTGRNPFRNGMVNIVNGEIALYRDLGV